MLKLYINTFFFLDLNFTFLLEKKQMFLWVPKGRRLSTCHAEYSPPEAHGTSGSGSFSDTFILLGQEIWDEPPVHGAQKLPAVP